MSQYSKDYSEIITLFLVLHEELLNIILICGWHIDPSKDIIILSPPHPIYPTILPSSHNTTIPRDPPTFSSHKIDIHSSFNNFYKSRKKLRTSCNRIIVIIIIMMSPFCSRRRCNDNPKEINYPLWLATPGATHPSLGHPSPCYLPFPQDHWTNIGTTPWIKNYIPFNLRIWIIHKI